jgi:iron complex transport system substrate-binding protein
MALSLIMGLLLITSNSMGESSEDGSIYPKTITDGANRTITITQPIERVVVLNSDIAEALKILGEEDKIIAVTDSVKARAAYFPDLSDKQVIGTWTEFDYEMISEIAKGGNDDIEPDIIVLGYAYIEKPYGAPAVEKSLEPFGNILCAGFDIHKPDEFARDLMTLGEIFDKEAEAQEYLDWYNGKIQDVEDAVDGLNLVKVYQESSSTSPKIGELGTYGKGAGITQLIRIAGGDNVAKDLEVEWPKVDWEWVMTQSPEVIILNKYATADQLGWEESSSNDLTILENILNEIGSRPGASSVPAVETGRIYLFDAYKFFGPDGVVGLTYLAKAFHPESDLDPSSVEKEYFQHIGIDFPDNVISVYPEIEDA